VMEGYKSVAERVRDLEEVRLTLRLPRGLHRQLVAEAKAADISLNKPLVFALIDHVSPGVLMLATKEEWEQARITWEKFRADVKAAAGHSTASRDEIIERWRRGELVEETELEADPVSETEHS
jgi:hypothetical protein